MKKRTLRSKLLCLLLLSAIFGGAFAVPAQRLRKLKAKPLPPTTTIETRCSGGWSGTIKYSLAVENSESWDKPGLLNNSRDIYEMSDKKSYDGKLLIDGGGSAPIAVGSAVLQKTEKIHNLSKSFGSCSAFKEPHWFVTDGEIRRTENAAGSGEGEFDLRFNEEKGLYSFSFRLPDIKGEHKETQRVAKSGYCQAQNNLPYNDSNEKPLNVAGERGGVTGQKIDPKNPNVLQGSVTYDLNEGKNSKIKEPVINISWKFRRCASSALVITDLKFYQPLYPSPNSWAEIRDDGYTIDGNRVKIVATVANLSGEAKSAVVNFKELTGKKDLPEAKIQVSVAPREEKEVEYLWDTSGYAWKESAPSNAPAISRSIEASIPNDALSRAIFINPKPVVIVPGLWSKPEKAAQAVAYFKNQNVPWAVAVAPVFVGKKARENAPVIDQTVRELQRKENAWHVDLVAHATGGLGARVYLDSLMPTQFDNRPTAFHLVMLGTPNMGTPCSAKDDVTKNFNREAAAFDEISHENMEAFNQAVKNRQGARLMAIAGDAVSPVCNLNEPGDGVVPWVSARYNYQPSVNTNVAYADLLGDEGVFLQIRKWLALAPGANFDPAN